ncbi:MAG: hypothetical protein JST68_28015 [Bacteroidetes bacterium]|nr:hypothetical protein [Bacteroidota bacterium]
MAIVEDEMLIGAKISFEENARRGKEILAKRKEISFERALAQIQWLKANSKVGQSLKKSRLNF